MHIIIAGGTGYIGRALVDALVGAGHAVTVLTRRAGAAGGATTAPWDPATGELPEETRALFARADGVVNLAGESIADGRWTPERKARLLASRIDATRAIVAAMDEAARPGAVLVSASAVGYYGDRGEEVLTEASGPGHGFLADLARAWEEEAEKAPGTVRVVRARLGVVYSWDGGALPEMARPFQFGAGGPLGSGRQWISWIHRDDAVAMLRWALEEPRVVGPLNVVAPKAARNRDVARAIGGVLHRPALVPAPAFALRALLGEFADTLLTGQHVRPDRAQRLGFRWQRREIEEGVRR